MTAALLVAVVAVVSVGDRGSSGDAPAVTQPTTTSVELAFDVPWVDRPYPQYPITTLPRADARPCTGNDVSISQGDSEVGGSTLVTGYEVTNKSETTCTLGGYPEVVATEPGLPSVAALRSGVNASQPPANLAPGDVGVLVIYTGRCDYSVSTSTPARTYHRLVVTMPGGGRALVDATVNLACGVMSVQPLSVRQPVPPPPTWHSSLTTILAVPPTVHAGSTLIYVATLSNQTDHSIRVSPCPIYNESLIGAGVVVKVLGELNCDRVREIPAAGRVRYEMRAPIASNATTGELRIRWGLSESVSSGAEAAVRVLPR